MAVQTIPEEILAKHPEMAPIFEALVAYSEGRRVTSHCPKCTHLLVVTDIPEAGSRWVTCDSGCTSYHEKYQPLAPSAA
jgi:hypothetical protein